MGNPRRIKLTKEKIKGLEYEGTGNSRRIFWDKDVTGFGCRIYPSGQKSYVLSYWFEGKKKLLTLGNCSDWPLSTTGQGENRRQGARNWAQELRVAIDRGDDPLNDRKGSREPGLTTTDLFEAYIADLRKNGKRWAAQVDGFWKRELEPFKFKDRSLFAEMPAAEVTEDHIRDILAPIVQRGKLTAADRCRQAVRACFEFGRVAHKDLERRGKVPNFGIAINPAVDIKAVKGANNVGERHLTADELRRLWGRIGNEMEPHTALAVKLIVSTGQRVEEVLHAEWGEFEGDRWTIPAARRKNGQAHIVPLTADHSDLLDKIRPFSADSRWLFPHRDGEQPRKCDSLNQAVHRFCSPQGRSQRKPFDKFTPRDLRRTWKSLAGDAGISLELRNRIQGHSFQGVGSKHYDRHDYLPEKMAAMGVWAEYLDKLLAPQVLTMRKRKAG